MHGSGLWKSFKAFLSNSVWYTPIEFESLGDKGECKNWRKSIYHENVQLGVFLPSTDVHAIRGDILPLLELLVPLVLSGRTLVNLLTQF